MLNTPGHTPGHHSLLVKLPQMDHVVISGDAVHFRENYDNNGVPYDRSQTLASIARLKGIVSTFKATLII
jgi:glyoxylase-like metal-dependent hydrolase (beta-lactamase superfamily II)